MPEIHQSTPVSLAFAGRGTPPPAGLSSGDGGALFQREVEAAVERDGGARLRDERSQELVSARRDRRDQGFERYDQRQRDERLQDDRRLDDSDAGHAYDARSQRAPEARAQLADATEDAGQAPGTRALRAQQDPARASAGATPQDAAADDARAAQANPTGSPGAGVMPAAKAPPGAPAAGAPPAAPSSAARAVTPAPPAASVARSTAGAEPASAPARAPAGSAVLERAEEILRQIRLAIQPDAKHVVLELEPRDLGRLSIRMSLRRGELATVVRVESSETLGLLEQRAQELRALLAERGFESSDLSFELGFGARHRAPRHDPPADIGGTGGLRDVRDPLHDRRCVEPVLLQRSSPGGIDTYA
jgi:flagellar hook-length control protein FliK